MRRQMKIYTDSPIETKGERATMLFSSFWWYIILPRKRELTFQGDIMSTLAEKRREAIAAKAEARRAITRTAKELAGRLSPELIVDDYTLGRITEKLVEQGTIRMGYYDFQVDPRCEYFQEVSDSYRDCDTITKNAFGRTVGFFGSNGDYNYMNKRLYHIVAEPEYVYTVVADYLKDFDIVLTKTKTKDSPYYTLTIKEDK